MAYIPDGKEVAYKTYWNLAVEFTQVSRNGNRYVFVLYCYESDDMVKSVCSAYDLGWLSLIDWVLGSSKYSSNK